MADIKENFKFIKKFNVSHIQEILSSLSADEWNRTIAQIFGAHKDCYSIFLKNDLRPEHYYGTYHKHWTIFKEALAPILNEIDSFYASKGQFIRIQFSKHLPQTGFHLHHDDFFSQTLVHSHRIHLCIHGNSDIWFEVDGERKKFNEGEAWEINNSRMHQGMNESNIDRVNLILDYALPFHESVDIFSYFGNLQHHFNGLGYLCIYHLCKEDQKKNNIKNEEVRSFFIKICDLKTGKVVADNFKHEAFSLLTENSQIPREIESTLKKLKVGEETRVKLNLTKYYGDTSPERIRILKNKPSNRAKAVFNNKSGYYLNYYKLGKFYLENANHPFSVENSEITLRLVGVRAKEKQEPRFQGGYLGLPERLNKI